MRDYLRSLARPIKPKCEDGRYYLVNNYNPGYSGDGSIAHTDANADNYVYTIPPTSARSIGDALADKKVSWAYFGGLWNAYLKGKYQTGAGAAYCNICN